MPSTTIHLKVGEYCGKKMGITSYDYYLGLIAPDSPNIDGLAPKEVRWMAHQRKKDYQEWKKSIKDYIEKVKKEYQKDFLIGYYIHVLTDIIYDEYYYLEIRENIMKNNISLENAHSEMRKDMEKYSFSELNQIKNILLKEEITYDILNITKEMMQIWKVKKMKEAKEENQSIYMNKVIPLLEEKVYEEYKANSI